MPSLSARSLMSVLQFSVISQPRKAVSPLRRLAFLLLFCSLSALLNCGGGGGSSSGGNNNNNNGAPPAPAISSLSPSSGAVGAAVTITGSNFGASQGSSTITFNGISAGPASAWSATSITVNVPTGATTGNVVVTVSGVASNGALFTAAPIITTLGPNSGAAGATLTITGLNFGASQGSSSVTFNGISAGAASAWSATSITIQVPSGATTGIVIVNVGGQASNGLSFTVAPVITSLSANSGVAGSALTITGLNFGANQGNSTVTFNGISAGAASAWSATSITVTVPSGAKTGNIIVSVGGQASNASPFTVGASSANTVTGTASLGAPIAGASVTLKDANGNISTTTTASDGTFTLNSGGLAPPFLMQVVTTAASGSFPTGTTLYSVSADASATTHINVHVLTDFIVRSWYSAQGLNVDNAFGNPVASGNAPPSPLAVRIIATTAIQVMQLWLSGAGITATADAPSNGSTNLISSMFSANNTGLDSVLHITTETVNPNNGSISSVAVASGSITEAVTPTYSGGTITVNTMTTDSSTGASTTGSVSAVLPTTSATQAAINGINSGLGAFQNTVNTKGSALTSTDLLPFYAGDYLNDGGNATDTATKTARQLAGVTINSLQIDSIKNLDVTNNIADVIVVASITAGTTTQTNPTELFFKQEGSNWLLYGNQHVGQVFVTAQSRTAQGAPSLGPGVSHGTYIAAGVQTPHGVVTAARVSGGGNIWNGGATGTLTQGATISQNGQIFDNFFLLSQSLGSNVSQLPAAGTPFTLSLTTASSGSLQYTIPSNNFTTEVIGFKGLPGSGPLSSIVGKTVTYNWSLPTTYSIGQVNLSAYIYDGAATNSATHSCSVGAGNLPLTATSGSINFPTDMSACGLGAGVQIQQVNVFLEVSGVNGEDNLVALVYPYSIPTIASLSPSSGSVGTAVTITGSNFGTSQGSSIVRFNGVSAGTASAWSPTSITVNVPIGATTGNVVVAVLGRPSNGLLFTVVPPPPDFSISVSPSSIITQAGTTSAPAMVSVTGLNGFSASVAVSVSGLPAGFACSPSCPLTIDANSAAQVAFVVPANAMNGNIALNVQGTSGTLNHSASLALNVTTSLQGFWNLALGSSLVSQNGADVSGKLFVSGWAFEAIPLTSIGILVDNVAIGNAFYGTPRPDIARGIAGAPEDCGFSLAVDTTKLSNGLHTISVNVTDSANNVAAMTNFPNGPATTMQVNVNNPAPAATGPVANLTVSAPTTSLVVGTIVQFSASATDGSGQPVSPSFSWSSTNPSVVKVTPTGAVLPLAAGTATISVAAGGKTQQVAVAVQAGSGTPGTIQVSLGPEEVVFQYPRDACMEGDYSDNPARAVRLSDGSVLLDIGGNPLYFADFGADFYSLKRRCSPILVSSDSPMASTFMNRQWIFSLYSDGSTIHALIHNEYHDPIAATCRPGDSTDGNPCQYNSITYATSTDGGLTFTTPPSPQNVVAPPPVQWTPPAQGVSPFYYGYQEPTNIVHAADGFYYARFGEFPPPGQPYFGGNCVMRTQTLSDPTSWRAWDGTAFALLMTDPYTGPSASLCTPTNGTVPYESLTFNTYLNMYMLVGLDSDFSASGPTNCGFHFSLSSDLVNWSPQQLIAPAYVPSPSQCQKPGAGGLAGSFAYASIIDHDDSSINFEKPGRTPYLYYSRFNDNSESRDVVRVPVIITKY